MIYFIGGPPRVGKSRIAATIARAHGISCVATDPLGAILETVLSPESEPDLRVVSRFDQLPEADRVEPLSQSPARRIEYQVAESRAVWRAVVPYARRESEEGRCPLVEGVAVLPELVAGLEGLARRAVFLGNQGAAHGENIKRGAVESEHDWMRHASDRYIEAFAAFVIVMSKYVESEAGRYGLDYVELDGKPLDGAAADVERLLLR